MPVQLSPLSILRWLMISLLLERAAERLLDFSSDPLRRKVAPLLLSCQKRDNDHNPSYLGFGLCPLCTAAKALRRSGGSSPGFPASDPGQRWRKVGFAKNCLYSLG